MSETAEQYRGFIRGVASWFGAWGVHSAIFSWLLTVKLNATPEQVGFGQFSVMLPTLLLILFGGALADRVDVRKSLIVLHLLSALGPLVLAVLVSADLLSYNFLLLYGVWLGTITAFIMPARDTLLSRVAGSDMLKAVAGMTMVQFGCQAVGNLLAGLAKWTGAAPVLVLQGIILASGALLIAKIRFPKAAAFSETPKNQGIRATKREIIAAIKTVAKDPRLRSTFLMSLTVAFCFAGPFYVIFPLIVRDSYGGSVLLLAIIMTLFALGNIGGSFWIRRLGGLKRRGQSALVSILLGSLLLLLISLDLAVAWMAGLTFIWGISTSIFINATRTLFQEGAPEHERGRVLSVYQLALMGAGPMGSTVAGFSSAAIGNHATLALYAATILVLAMILWRPVSDADAIHNEL